jgi:peptide chain release factor 3
MDVCRLRDTPIITFINKLDREGREPIELLDEVESVLKIQCAPITWPIGMGKRFKGVYHLLDDSHAPVRRPGHDGKERRRGHRGPRQSAKSTSCSASRPPSCATRSSWCAAPATPSTREAYLAGTQTPVFFGSALNNFGVQELLDGLVENAPPPHRAPTATREGRAHERRQVHRLRVQDPGEHGPATPRPHRLPAHLFRPLQPRHEAAPRAHRPRREVANAMTFMAAEREHAEEAYPGDIIGLHNHGTIRIGDTFTQGEDLKFTGIPNFAPELFRRARCATR